MQEKKSIYKESFYTQEKHFSIGHLFINTKSLLPSKVELSIADVQDET